MGVGFALGLVRREDEVVHRLALGEPRRESIRVEGAPSPADFRLSPNSGAKADLRESSVGARCGLLSIADRCEPRRIPLPKIQLAAVCALERARRLISPNSSSAATGLVTTLRSCVAIDPVT
jgi:hypothetical protein